MRVCKILVSHTSLLVFISNTDPATETNVYLCIKGLYLSLLCLHAQQPFRYPRMFPTYRIPSLFQRVFPQTQSMQHQSKLALSSVLQILKIVQRRECLGKVDEAEVVGKATANE